MLIDHLNGPLCPQSLPPMSIEHRRSVDISNALYNKIPKDADGEMLPEFEEVYRQLPSDFMRLYRASWTGLSQGEVITVASYYWRCQTCGFVLPATEVK